MWPSPQEIADLLTFTEEIPNEKFHFLCSIISPPWYNMEVFSKVISNLFLLVGTEKKKVSSADNLEGP